MMGMKKGAAAALLLSTAAAVLLSTAAGDTASASAYFTVEADQEAQVILGMGFEIQADSIGRWASRPSPPLRPCPSSPPPLPLTPPPPSRLWPACSGNHGLPESNSSVPNDLTQPEKDRFFTDMLTGFRFCRLALGLYFRGLTPDGKNVVERWPGQAAGLAEMVTKAGLEGMEVEYWSPPPGWKSTSSYIDGTLVGFDAATLSAFASAVAADALYLVANGIPVVWWGLQNEPPVGPSGCIYSCCGYDAEQYYQAFKPVATAIRAALPDVVIHVGSWSGQHYSPSVASDPETLALVDAWTYHRVGADSSDCISSRAYFLEGAEGRPVLNNEYEYLDSKTNAERTINTAQDIMNWFTFENSPTWFWLHALKPLTNSESAGYGLGYWQPWNASAGGSRSGGEPSPSPLNTSIPAGTWEYNMDNWPSLAGFTKYLPWNSVRVNVTEDSVRENVRVLAYRYDPTRARWLPGQWHQPLPQQGEARRVLRDGTAQRAAATKLAFVVTNRYNDTVVDATVSWAGLGGVGPRVVAGGAPLPVFIGHLYGPNTTDAPLGTLATQVNATTGLPYFTATLAPLSISFWVEQ